jgi:DNA mismatch repair protein MutS
MASLEHLHNKNSTFLFATHFHEILDYSELRELDKLGVYHMSVIYDREKNELIYDRKLKQGPGRAMYGLEVCKSLDLPDDFIERSYILRNKYTNQEEYIFQEKASRYNVKKLKGICEICKTDRGTEIHHLQFQKNADKLGVINNEFNKNKKANLINICDLCHDKIHKTNSEYRIAKTTSGYKFVPINV